MSVMTAGCIINSNSVNSTTAYVEGEIIMCYRKCKLYMVYSMKLKEEFEYGIEMADELPFSKYSVRLLFDHRSVVVCVRNRDYRVDLKL